MPREAGKVTIYVLLCCLFLTGHALPATAQYDPAVEIDMSVLGGGALNPSSTVPIPTMQRAYKPTLTRQPEAVQHGSAASGIKVFPVQVHGRSELIDPSLPTTPDYDNTPVKKPVRKVSAPSPIPPMKPVASMARMPSAATPIPPSLPAARKATAVSFAVIEPAAGAARKAAKTATYQIKSDSASQDFKVAAVPAGDVHVETLYTPPDAQAYMTDDLASQLVTPDKQSMVESIEKITAMADALAAKNDPAPVQKAPLQKKTADAILQRVDATVFTRQTLMPLPKQKPEPAGTADDLADIAPAAGDMQVASLGDSAKNASLIPRKPPQSAENESAYFSVPYLKGQSGNNSIVLETLDNEVLPLLQDNGQWRLQIQAFADKTDKSTNSARRMSLTRALNIRSYLMEHGIDASRIDVRALGMQTDRDPVDRIDFVFFDPQG